MKNKLNYLDIFEQTLIIFIQYQSDPDWKLDQVQQWQRGSPLYIHTWRWCSYAFLHIFVIVFCFIGDSGVAAGFSLSFLLSLAYFTALMVKLCTVNGLINIISLHLYPVSSTLPTMYVWVCLFMCVRRCTYNQGKGHKNSEKMPVVINSLINII